MNDEREFDLSDETQASHRIVQADKEGLLRVLRVRDLFALGYSDVGSSIYYALGVTALYALGATPLALGLAGIAFFCTTLTYAEMSSALPEAGGSSSFARHAFNDLVSFIAGWALLLDYIVTIAISVFTVGPYLSYFFPALHGVANIPFSLCVLGVLLALNIFGIKESTRVSLLICLFDIATQLSIIVIGGLFLLNIPHVFHQMRIGVPGVDWSPTWPQFWKGVSMAMVAYIGIESIAQLGGEARHASRSVPRAMLLTMVALFVMYFGISTIALSVIHPKVLSTQYLEDPLAGIALALPVGGRLLAPWVGILGATILFVAANAGPTDPGIVDVPVQDDVNRLGFPRELRPYPAVHHDVEELRPAGFFPHRPVSFHGRPPPAPEPAVFSARSSGAPGTGQPRYRRSPGHPGASEAPWHTAATPRVCVSERPHPTWQAKPLMPGCATVPGSPPGPLACKRAAGPSASCAAPGSASSPAGKLAGIP